MNDNLSFMRLAIRLARKGRGMTAPNPMVGAVLVQHGKIIGRGWHRRAGWPHAEIEALEDVKRRGLSARNSTLFVTLEPCCTHGRTPPCTKAILAAGIKRIVVGATDPNPKHAGKGFQILRRAGCKVVTGILAAECTKLNEGFNHWITAGMPFTTVKAAMTLDGKIATANGQSKWITGERARRMGMRLRRQSDAILVGVNTIIADDPSLTDRAAGSRSRLRRIVLDTHARTPLRAKVLTDEHAELTTIVVGKDAPPEQVAALMRSVNVLVAPTGTKQSGNGKQINLRWLLQELGSQHVTSLLVEGGGEVNASFLLNGFAQRIAFFYAPKILGGGTARKAVAGEGISNWRKVIRLHDSRWQKLGADLLLTARVG